MDGCSGFDRAKAEATMQTATKMCQCMGCAIPAHHSPYGAHAVRFVTILHVPPVLHERLGIDSVRRIEVALCAACADWHEKEGK